MTESFSIYRHSNAQFHEPVLYRSHPSQEDAGENVEEPLAVADEQEESKP